MAFHKQQHADHRKGGIVNQQFEANLIIPDLQRPPLHQRTQCRGREGHQRHPAVAHPAARHHAEGKHAEDRTVGVAGAPEAGGVQQRGHILVDVGHVAVI
mgnify:CR=1 FL=1